METELLEASIGRDFGAHAKNLRRKVVYLQRSMHLLGTEKSRLYRSTRRGARAALTEMPRLTVIAAWRELREI